MLTERDRQYFDSLEEVFESQGWRHIVTDADALIEQSKEDLATKPLTNEETWYLRGRISALRELVHYDAYTRNNRQALEEDAEEDAGLDSV